MIKKEENNNNTANANANVADDDRDDDDIEDELDLDADDLHSEMGESRSDRMSEHGNDVLSLIMTFSDAFEKLLMFIFLIRPSMGSLSLTKLCILQNV